MTMKSTVLRFNFLTVLVLAVVLATILIPPQTLARPREAKKFYYNQCYFNEGMDNIECRNAGWCTMMGCSHSYYGSDGTLYYDACEFRAKLCDNPNLRICNQVENFGVPGKPEVPPFNASACR